MQEGKEVRLMGNCLEMESLRRGRWSVTLSSCPGEGGEVPLGYLRDEGSKRIRQKGGNGLLAGYHGNPPPPSTPFTTSSQAGSHRGATEAERVEDAIFRLDVFIPFSSVPHL